MISLFRMFFLLTIFIFSLSSHADWAEPGAAYICDKSANLFILQATMDSESAPVVGPRSGYRQITAENTQITCDLRYSKIKLSVKLESAHPSGICGGIPHVWLDDFLINKKFFFEYSTLFNDTCSGDPVLYEIRIHDEDAPGKPEICHTTWNWNDGYGEPACENI